MKSLGRQYTTNLSDRQVEKLAKNNLLEARQRLIKTTQQGSIKSIHYTNG